MSTRPDFPHAADRRGIPDSVIFAVFVLSGFSALVYQLVWQRALLTLYGSNVESVAMVVAAFMIGLGLGSIAGGLISRSTRIPLVVAFALAETGIGVYGLISLRLFRAVGDVTLGAGSLATGGLAFALVFLPTLLMGATLPILVAYQVNASGRVGRSVSWLYFVNTLGASLGAFMAALVILGRFGQSGSVTVAASLNALAAVAIFLSWWVASRPDRPARPSEPGRSQASAISDQPAGSHLSASPATFGPILILAGISGFIALSWEILWARFYSVATASRAPAFGIMLGSYLLGLAAGSLLSMRWHSADSSASRRSVASLIASANLVAFAVIPVASWMIAVLPEGGSHFPLSWMGTLPLIAVAAALQGTILPLLCHVSIPADSRAGQRLSFVYLANIAGAGAGSLFTGFIWMNHHPVSMIAAILCVLACVIALAVTGLPARRPFGFAAMSALSAALIVPAGALFHSGLWERLSFRNDYHGQRYPSVIESRHGVIAIDSNQYIYGNGAYDGHIATSLTPGDWHVRPYFLSAVHPDPRRILVIGLSGGAWTQILVSHPQAEHVDVVEISRSYLDVVESHPEVSSLLTNSRVAIHIDDGRRWMKRNPDRRYDAIVMNTTHHWREFASSLLSVEFLTLAKNRLAPGGLVIWNCTDSSRAAKTGLDVFPHTMMVLNTCIGSLAPIRVDRDRWRRVLVEYRIDGRPVFDLSAEKGQTDLRGVLALADNVSDPPPSDADHRWWIVDRERMERLWGAVQPITDDNLGHEYQ